MTTYHDITKMKKTKIELQVSKMKYKEAEKMANMGHWDLDIENDKLCWSDEIFNIFQIKKNEFGATYEAFLQNIHPEDRKMVDDRYRASLTDQIPYDLIHRLLLSDGTIKYVHEKCATEFDDTGKPLNSFGMVWDITDQIMWKNEIKMSEEKIRKFLELSPQPILITDAQGIVIEINKKFSQIYGYGAKEMIGKNVNCINSGLMTYENFGFDEVYYKNLFEDLWQSITDDEIGYWDGIVINRKKNGEVIWVNLTVNSVFDDEGRALYHIAQQVDITQFHQKDLKNKLEFYKSIALMAEIRDNETGNHMKRVGLYAKFLALEMGLSNQICIDIENFAPMHDIGKLGIPDSILLAPRKLTVEEYEKIKNHTVLGYHIISKNEEMKMASDIALMHHERWDGNGYPNQLVGEEIPIYVRITSVADVYDALRSKRPYKSGWEHEDALVEILDQSGKMFDPEVVGIFEKINKKIENIYIELKD